MYHCSGLISAITATYAQLRVPTAHMLFSREAASPHSNESKSIPGPSQTVLDLSPSPCLSPDVCGSSPNESPTERKLLSSMRLYNVRVLSDPARKHQYAVEISNLFSALSDNRVHYVSKIANHRFTYGGRVVNALPC